MFISDQDPNYSNDNENNSKDDGDREGDVGDINYKIHPYFSRLAALVFFWYYLGFKEYCKVLY